MLSFGGKPSGDGFSKRYELHYQPKKMDADGVEKYQQFGYINFHAWWGVGAKLTPAIKNKRSTRWTKVWFYCKVPTHLCAQGGKAMYHLYSHMCSLDFRTEPPFDCGNDDSGEAAFVRATKFIGGWDVMVQFVDCDMHPLAAGVGFDKVATLVTRVSKLRVPLPKFVAVHKDSEDDVQFLARVELEAEGIVGSYTRPEHDACITNLRNGGCLNWVFKLVEVAYGPRPEPGTEEFTEAFKKGEWMLLGRIRANTRERLGRRRWKPRKLLCRKEKLLLRRENYCVMGKRWPKATVRRGGGFGSTD
jgi:hypothetical protein